MTNPINLQILIPADAVPSFRDAAATAQMDQAAFALDAILNQLEMTLRYRTMLARIESVDRAIGQIAEMISEMSALGDGQLDLTLICRAACPGNDR